MSESNPFQKHADVTRAYPDLFEGLSQSVIDTVRSTMADSILEGRMPTREAVSRKIRRYVENPNDGR